jgi:hypothetical protein
MQSAVYVQSRQCVLLTARAACAPHESCAVLSRSSHRRQAACQLHEHCCTATQADPGCLSPAAGSKGPALVILQADAEGPKSYDGAFESADLAAWVEKAAAPAIVTLDQ